jgi:hypothetical protein
MLLAPADAVLSTEVTSYPLTDGDTYQYKPVWAELHRRCVRESQYYMAYHPNHHDNNWNRPRLKLLFPLGTNEYMQGTVNHNASFGAFA